MLRRPVPPMQVFRSESELADRITIENSVSGFLLGVDGSDGSGKTTLSSNLKTLLGASLVSVDDFQEKAREAYVPVLKIPELQRAIAGQSGPVIVEGVCLLDDLKKAEIRASRLICVKKLSPFGFWKDEDECEPPDNIEAFIAKQVEGLRFTSQLLSAPDRKVDSGYEDVRLPGFAEELIRYHWKYRPARRADYIFERIED
jgi:hypothetical protein